MLDWYLPTLVHVVLRKVKYVVALMAEMGFGCLYSKKRVEWSSYCKFAFKETSKMRITQKYC